MAKEGAASAHEAIVIYGTQPAWFGLGSSAFGLPTDQVTMPFRDFVDDDGRRWRAWGAYPSSHQLGRDTLLGGWLCFESGGERRHVAPLPVNWQLMSDEAMRVALNSAEVVRSSPIGATLRDRADGAGAAEARPSP